MKSDYSLYQALLESKNKFPDNNALLFMGKYLKYKDLILKIDKLANGFLKLGLKQDMVLTMALPNVFEAVFSFYAANKLGVIGHMVHPITPIKQMKKFMNQTKSKTLIIMDSFFEQYQELLSEGIKLILVSPVSEFGLIKKVAYRLINRKKLKKIKYGINVFKLEELYVKQSLFKEVEGDSFKTATYLHSGGTSGEPKTIELSNYSINYLASLVSHIMGVEDFKNKHMLAVLPMFHGFGLCMGIHGMLRFGGVNTLMPKFKAEEAIKLIHKNRINYLIGVPSLFEALLRNPKFHQPKTINIDQAFIGGDYVAMDLKKHFDQAMSNVKSQAKLLEGYGLTEVVTVCCVNTLACHLHNSVGKPLPGIDIAIRDLDTLEFIDKNLNGEIVISGPTIMKGYLNDLEATNSTIFKRDGRKWVASGDLGFIDEAGFIHFKQRLKRIIKVSGIPVLPAEIENLMMSYEAISEVGAIGVADEIKGNVIKLFIVYGENQRVFENEKIKEIIKSNLGIYAVPKDIVILNQLPKTPIGKTDVLALEKM